ncbi:hypothetical protein K7X08_032624 [Anisodus acutangulus]|uniref:Uncharacterized protein n=1 Tax=Anisodus acutangulus TaxID=402998 RepID=A0A9Q1M0Z9_9SOLA|nr:hypothetical protein K7X08_032624 [Anisodus acutangulus]
MGVEIPVFVDTNLDTRIVVPVSLHTTPNDFKRELERAHLNCFPQLGQIKVDAVMVERNSCFYHLPETLPLKHVFQHLKGFRSLHVEVCQYDILYKPGSSELNQHGDVICTISDPTKLKTSMKGTKFDKLKCRRKVKKKKRFPCLRSTLSDVLRIIHSSKKKKKTKKKRNKTREGNTFNCLEVPDDPIVVSKASSAHPAYGREGRGDEEQSSCPAAESNGEDLSEAVSVSGIIRKYFSSHDEVNSSSRFSDQGAQTLQGDHTGAGTNLRDLNVERASLSPFPVKTPLQISDESVSRASINKSKGIEIGSRIVSASKGLSSLRSRRLLPKSASLIRNLAFEISDGD